MFPTIASDFDVEWGVACDFFWPSWKVSWIAIKGLQGCEVAARHPPVG